MATYNKRGYKAPKPKEDKIDNELKTNPQFKDIIDALTSKIK